MRNLGVAPRLGFAWDPGRRGRDLLTASIGRYYTTIPGTVGGWERQGVAMLADCYTDSKGRCLDRAYYDQPHLYYTDPNTHLPQTDEVTVGYERAMARELVAEVRLTGRKGTDLLQDVDGNNYYTDVDPETFAGTPHWRNHHIDNLFVIGNHNRSRYAAAEIALRRRWHGAWQLLASYTYARAKGDGAWLATAEGDDTRLSSVEYAPLPWDERHVVKVDASVALPLGFTVAASGRYFSGTPYSVLVPNFRDENGNGFPDTGETGYDAGYGEHYLEGKLSRRNGAFTNLDVRVERSFPLGPIDLGLSIDTFNLLNDRSVIETYAKMRTHNTYCDPEDPSCKGPGTIDTREVHRFGRRFQVGAVVRF